MPLARSARTTSRARPSLDHRRNADTGCYCHAGARARPNRSSPCWHTARPSAYLAPAHTDTGWWPRVLALAVSLTRCTSHESSGRRYLCAERIENSVCRSWDRIRFHWPLTDTGLCSPAVLDLPAGPTPCCGLPQPIALLAVLSPRLLGVSTPRLSPVAPPPPAAVG